jgi:hypothetical protein
LSGPRLAPKSALNRILSESDDLLAMVDPS